MIEAYLVAHTGFVVVWLFMIHFTLKNLNATIEAIEMPKLDVPELKFDNLADQLEDRILETIQNMRPPSAIDHLAGMWGQIMMMREQAKMMKDGLLPNSDPNEPEIVENR